jgi:hypothetical protein
MSAPVSPTAFFKSTLFLPTLSAGGSDTVSTGYTAFTPVTERRVATCDAATDTERPFQSESYA